MKAVERQRRVDNTRRIEALESQVAELQAALEELSKKRTPRKRTVKKTDASA